MVKQQVSCQCPASHQTNDGICPGGSKGHQANDAGNGAEEKHGEGQHDLQFIAHGDVMRCLVSSWFHDGCFMMFHDVSWCFMMFQFHDVSTLTLTGSFPKKENIVNTQRRLKETISEIVFFDLPSVSILSVSASGEAWYLSARTQKFTALAATIQPEEPMKTKRRQNEPK